MFRRTNGCWRFNIRYCLKCVWGRDESRPFLFYRTPIKQSLFYSFIPFMNGRGNVPRLRQFDIKQNYPLCSFGKSPGNAYFKSMSDKFMGIYRNGTNRLIGYDYGSPNHYFITICVKYRTPVFGKITDSIMHLSPLGIHAVNEWKRSDIMRPDTNI